MASEAPWLSCGLCARDSVLGEGGRTVRRAQVALPARALALLEPLVPLGSAIFP